MASLALASRPTNALQLCAACTDVLGLHDDLLWWKCTTCYYGDDSQRDDALHVAMVTKVYMLLWNQCAPPIMATEHDLLRFAACCYGDAMVTVNSLL